VRQLEGRSMRLRLSPDGTVGMAQKGREVPKEVSDIVDVMPASFPRDSVSVGESWTREMPIARGSTLGAPVGGVVRANFRLDSVSRSGDVAYVSMQGTLDQQPAPATSEASISGTVNGTMVVNRRRGWLSETRFLVQMRSTVTSKTTTPGTASPTPMQFRMKITQHMRVFDKRP